MRGEAYISLEMNGERSPATTRLRCAANWHGCRAVSGRRVFLVALVSEQPGGWWDGGGGDDDDDDNDEDDDDDTTTGPARPSSSPGLSCRDVVSCVAASEGSLSSGGGRVSGRDAAQGRPSGFIHIHV